MHMIYYDIYIYNISHSIIMSYGITKSQGYVLTLNVRGPS